MCVGIVAVLFLFFVGFRLISYVPARLPSVTLLMVCASLIPMRVSFGLWYTGALMVGTGGGDRTRPLGVEVGPREFAEIGLCHHGGSWTVCTVAAVIVPGEGR